MLLLGIAVALLGFLVDARNTVKYAGADFRPRVVGYRLMVKGYDPYRFLWRPGMPNAYIDPYLPPGRDLTRTAVTPTTLLLDAPLEPLSYKVQRLAWLLVQWALLLGMLYLAGRAMSEEDRLTLWAVALLFVGGSYFWRLHVERGQVYVVYAFLFVCVFALAARARPASIVGAGLVLGLLVALRAPYAVALIPLVLAFRWRLVLSAVVGLAASVALPAVLFGSSIWLRYAHAMAAQGRQYLQWWGPPGPPLATASWYPRVIEGIGKWNTVSYPTFDSSVAYVARNVHVAVTATMVYACLFAVVAVLATSLWFAGRGRRARIEVLLLQGGLLAYVAEHFLIATRFSYRDVMLVPLLALVIAALGMPWLRRSRWAQVGIVGLAMGCVGGGWLLGADYGVLVGEVLCLVSLAALTFIAVRRQEQLSASPQVEPQHAARLR